MVPLEASRSCLPRLKPSLNFWILAEQPDLDININSCIKLKFESKITLVSDCEQVVVFLHGWSQAQPDHSSWWLLDNRSLVNLGPGAQCWQVEGLAILASAPPCF